MLPECTINTHTSQHISQFHLEKAVQEDKHELKVVSEKTLIGILIDAQYEIGT